MPTLHATETHLLTAREAADHLRISQRTLFTLTARGEIPAVRIGRAVRYRAADLTSYVERLVQGGAQ
ncbi:MAG TPA: helix-turn-helix domain-containing protein [Pirellulales bacterium]|jgi:excisionase family DNA binding protein|nr:helix-turn-helix domain-containing protein [Pirellulales bacterium]